MADSRRNPSSQNGRWLLAVQFTIGLSLIGWLSLQALEDEVFAELALQPIRYSCLVVGAALLAMSVGLSFVRWRLIAEAAGLPMTLLEATRFGAAGFAANFVALGNIGGDVIKAAMLAHNRAGRRALAVTTAIVDRLMGLFALLLFASGGVLASGLANSSTTDAVRITARGTLLVTVVASLCFLLAIAPGRPLWRLAFIVRRTPLIGRHLGEGLLLLDAYRSGRANLLAALAVGLVTDAAFVGSFYAVALALPLASPGLLEHLLIVPLGFIAGALPISPSGLGTIEATIDLLYQAIVSAPQTHGAIVTGAHRLVMLMLGGCAVAYYLASGERRRAEIAATEVTSKQVEEGSGTVSPGNTPSASRQTV